jgi:oligoribonuclease NrnB/cAMP/cGMP phosphodiesterase (DHH superfamily)
MTNNQQLLKYNSKNSNGMKSIAIIYHKNCPDGFSAAWSAWKKFGSKADYYAVGPNELPEVTLKNKEIYILDNSYSFETLTKLGRENKSVVVIDHHASNKKAILSFSQNVFDNDHSGAVLTWNYFHPKKSIPWLLKRVEDIDLWRFRYPDTKIADVLIEITDFSFAHWSTLVKNLENVETRKKLLAEGKVALRYEDELVHRLSENADVVNFCGIKTLVVNSPVLNSRIGNELCKKLPPIGIVWYEKEGGRRFSLRGDGSVDVSKLAAKFKGGGHHNSAGFLMPISESLPWKLMKK